MKAQDDARVFPLCFIDNFGYSWDVLIDHATGDITGTVRVILPHDCGYYNVEGQFNGSNVTLLATNPRGGDDPGCSDGQGCSDYFTYDGVLTRLSRRALTASGTWSNPCPGFGTFNGSGRVGACPPAVARDAGPVAMAPASAPGEFRGGQAAASASASGYEVTSYPNPFEIAATISFTLPERAAVRLAVHDVLGREVGVLVDGARPAGTHAVRWEADTSLPAGTYLYRLTVNERTETGRMMLVR